MNFKSNKFNSYLDACKKHEQHVGIGNPDSKILFIGKEAKGDIGTVIYHGSADSWYKQGNTYSKRFTPENTNSTWSKYQKLYDYIIDNLKNEKQLKKSNKNEITFVEKVFTTELSNLSANSSAEAKKIPNFKKELKNRKELIISSDFIQNFPVILIFTSDNKYMETYAGEVQKKFDVTFKKEIKLSDSSNYNRYWLNEADKLKNNKTPKILIHTIHPARASEALLKNIAKRIAQFIIKNDLIL